MKTLTVTLSTNDGASVAGQTVTLLNVATGEEVTEEYDPAGISFEVFGEIKYHLSVSDMECYIAPVQNIIVSDGDELAVDLKYELKHLNDLPWSKIIEISESGKADEFFSLLDEKEIELTTGEKVVVEIVGFDHDVLTDNEEQTAGITFGMKYHTINTWHRMNLTNTDEGGWETSEMRTIHIREHFYDVLPEELQDGIKKVNKKSYDKTTEDDVWLFSLPELGITEGMEANLVTNVWGGEKYPVFTSDSTRMRKARADRPVGVYYWTRSNGAIYTRTFYFIDIYGKADFESADEYLGMIVGFCV